MKRLKRLVISSLFVFGVLVAFHGTSVHAASGYQGFIGYRDGVIMNKQWHAGVFIRPDGPGGSNCALVAALGYGYVVQECSYSLFMDSSSNVYRKTGYKNYITSADKDKIVSTARYLAAMGSIQYTLSELISYGPGTGRIIYPGNIVNARCDGVSEYAYEFNGVPIQGNPWDISTQAGQAVHNAVFGMTPITQASMMNSY